ncbi:double-strand break repair helicase AddA [Sphingomonas sp. R-74633]|uniref:double-strand break repair helicase AddA n=1 Tax=Sphingomonas sp. R-74633 TaxID=2751188 RepID=UPI0015D1B777|nr:double-strand break repair helicase AddA [Sphingomonas sp. R-74633]NYT39596.1 double-strand break repair helicase AddA [Sphingomonas sp. R-74633]
MSEVRPLHKLKGNQKAASDPGRHIWLSASAGTGKTQVLAARVWRLLLGGTDPGAILCLTFTKAGAAEMSERITSRLARWVRASDTELAADLEALGENISPAGREKARQLFAKVLDAPGGGIRIQTIHSFCQSLLAAFPIEAGLVPGFRPLDQREEAVLSREALAEMLVDAERDGRGWIVDAVGALSLRLGEGKAEDFLKACAREGEALAALPILIQPYLREALGLPLGDVDAEIAFRCGDDQFDLASLRMVASMSANWGTKSGLERADIIAAWLAKGPEARAAGLADLHSVWATAKGDPRSFGKGQAPQDDGYADYAMRLHATCAELLGMKTQAAYADLLALGLEAGRIYAETYKQAKRRLGAVDFNDLIHRTVALLAEPGMGEWVRFKLDQATEHVLIDEAQDTNPQQWAIVSAIADEFFVGEGVRAETVRTLFTVGDYKQAIFGFQGTDPIFFRAAFERFLAMSRIKADADYVFDEGKPEPREVEELSLTHSFRSTRPVLEFVDAALGALPLPGMGELSDAEEHASEVPGPGTVTLWPPVTEGGSEADEEEWVSDATRKLAGDIARAIKSWVGTLELESKGRTLQPEDVMILVKRRGELASLIVARLYAEGVPVAGVDRLRLNAPLAVQDLLAAIRFALQPEDDLSLASLLVSPLIGWTQQELMDAAVRKAGGLWRHLRNTQPEERLAPLYALLARADIATPYRFLEEVLSGPLDGRRKLLRRLGEEARDPIEELLNATLNFEKLATPSLQRFLDWFDRGDVEIVRDAAQPQGAVRVMTAHGAKGLQAPLVILADATVDPTRSPRDFLQWEVSEASGKLPIFRPRAAERGVLADVIETADTRQLSEHWRLFYVAATRAEERLVIAGALGPMAKGVPPAKSWYAASAAALDALGVGEGETREFKGLHPQLPVPAKARPAEATTAVATLPDWARRPAPEEARPPRPLAPSSLGDDAVADPPPTPALRAAAERGRLLHALFERLPSVAPSERAMAAERWLAGAGGVADPALRTELVSAALAVTEDAGFAELFGPDSLGEAPIAAVVGEGVVVSGTVDRLVVTPSHVRVIDFKTGRRAPASLAEIPPYHLRQMAAYAAALAVIFPGRTIEAGLLYAAGPILHLLPAELLAAHKPGFVATEQSLASRA